MTEQHSACAADNNESTEPSPSGHISRRVVLETLAGLGIGSAVFYRAVAAQVQTGGAITAEMIQQAEWIAGLELKPKDRDAVARGLTRAIAGLEQLLAVKLDNSIAPALLFNPAPSQLPCATSSRGHVEFPDSPAPQRPSSDDDLAFLPVTKLARYFARQVSSVELTKLYLSRLRKYDPVLKCVITYADELALRQAERADRELAAGHYRGPLHGIPWGRKI